MPIHDWTRVDAGIFQNFHHAWISTIGRALNSRVLASDCYGLAERVPAHLGLDELSLETVGSKASGEGVDGAGLRVALVDGGIAVADAPPRVRFVSASELTGYARSRSRIVVRHRSGDSVVAIVEIISPGNKASQHALDSFVDKAVALLDAGIHLLVIDLLPPTPRDPQGIHGAIWSAIESDDFELPPGEPLTQVSYSAGLVKQACIEPTAVGATLIDMPLFLSPQRYVNVPLEATYRAAFDAVPKRWQQELAPKPDG